MVLFLWLLWGDFAWIMKERSAPPIAQILLKRFNASDTLIGILVGSIPAALGFILGPIVSVMSDNHRSRWGRRIPFLLIPTPIATLSIFGLAFSPKLGTLLHEWLGASSPGLNVSVILVFIFFWSTFEVASIIANSILGGLINDVVPQEVIGRFFGFFRAVSLGAGILFNYSLMGHVEEYYNWILISIGLLYGIGFTLTCLNVKEGEYPPPPPRQGFSPLRASKRYVRECFSNPFYRWIFAANTLAMLAFGPVNTFSIFYAKSVGMDMDRYGKCLALSFAISLMLSFFLGWLADKFHPVRLGLVSIAGYMLLSAWASFFSNTPDTFAFALVAHTVLSGIYLTATASIGQRLFPKLSFAQFASAAGLINGLFFATLPPLVGMALDLTGNIYRHTFFYGGILAAFSLVSFIILNRRFMRLGGPSGYVPPPVH